MPDYYDIFFKEYFDKTAHIDPAPFLSPLLEFLPEKAEIFDIGCGSGRDMAWLKSKGFKPFGLEKSPGMAEYAEKRSGCRIIKADFLTHDFSAYNVDCIILSASLVHQPHSRLLRILSEILKAMKSQGLIYISLKYGVGEKTDEAGRKFYLWQDHDLRTLFNMLCLKIVFHAITPSARGTSEIWLNYILKTDQLPSFFQNK